MPDTVSIVLPAYNEGRRISPTLAAWDAALAPYDGEIIVALDGCTDNTAAVVGAYAARHAHVRCLHLTPNRGKGAAVRDGMQAAHGAYRFYADADMGIGPEHLMPALDLLRRSYDVVLAQRDLGEYARAERSVSRVAAGAAVQVTRRLTVLPTIADTQAGFKGFRAAAAHDIFSRMTVDGFAFDIEMIYLARRRGWRIGQMPVTVTYQPESTYNVRRHLPPFLRDIWRVRTNAWRGIYTRGAGPGSAQQQRRWR